MFSATCKIIGKTTLSYSAPIRSQKKVGESHPAFEERIWQERIHKDADGLAFIPPNAIKNCLSNAAKYVGETVPGKGRTTYTKHFDAGVLVTDPLLLGVKADDIKGVWRFVPSDGQTGGGKRVWKCFPEIEKWEAETKITVIDPIIKPSKLEEYLRLAGDFIGLLRFRPQRRGWYGKFSIEDFQVVDE